MTSAIRLAVIILALIAALGAAAWYYLFGPNMVSAAQLVPSDTLFFATIPNAGKIAADYQTSRLKQLIGTPQTQPLLDSLTRLIGPKNVDLIQSFLPELSGQSFVALTHFDIDHPAKVGLIAGLQPKAGLGNFNAFVDKIKAAYPEAIAQGTTGKGQIEDLNYQWISGPGAPDKICVAQYRGWIITSWGEASLRDWWERLNKKSTSPSLAQNDSYKTSLDRVGKNSEALVYINYHTLLTLVQDGIGKGNPLLATYMGKQWQGLGAAALGARFENGEIADHFSTLMSHDAQVAAGISAAPCAFETLKFTSPDTLFYWGSSFNWAETWKRLQEQADPSLGVNPVMETVLTSLQSWAKSENIDVQHNIIDPIGNEISLQSEWSNDVPYPEVGLFIKLAKPDDFKPTVAAILDTLRKNYSQQLLVNEIPSNGQNFATIKLIQPFPFTPTITEDGPYFGLFLTENQAVRSFTRDASIGLLSNADFNRQIGANRKDASQIMFIDTPRLLNRSYQTAMPYLSLAAMFNPRIGALLQNQSLPPNLDWLAPMGTWSFVGSFDNDGMKGYSISGVGNQGIFLLGGLAAGEFSFLSTFNPALNPFSQFLHPTPATAAPTTPPPTPGPAPAVNASTNGAPLVPAASPVPSPDTNAAPSTASPTTNTSAASMAPGNSLIPVVPASTNATPSNTAPAQTP